MIVGLDVIEKFKSAQSSYLISCEFFCKNILKNEVYHNIFRKNLVYMYYNHSGMCWYNETIIYLSYSKVYKFIINHFESFVKKFFYSCTKTYKFLIFFLNVNFVIQSHKTCRRSTYPIWLNSFFSYIIILTKNISTS